MTQPHVQSSLAIPGRFSLISAVLEQYNDEWTVTHGYVSAGALQKARVAADSRGNPACEELQQESVLVEQITAHHLEDGAMALHHLAGCNPPRARPETGTAGEVVPLPERACGSWIGADRSVTSICCAKEIPYVQEQTVSVLHLEEKCGRNQIRV